MGPSARDERCSTGSVSGRNLLTQMVMTTPNAVRNQKIERQSPTVSKAPPRIGAKAGASPKIIDTWLIRRCASGPEKRSRITARAMI